MYGIVRSRQAVRRCSAGLGLDGYIQIADAALAILILHPVIFHLCMSSKRSAHDLLACIDAAAIRIVFPDKDKPGGADARLQDRKEISNSRPLGLASVNEEDAMRWQSECCSPALTTCRVTQIPRYKYVANPC